MGLINLQTDLTSLQFGVKASSDRPGSGNSNQPYITDPIGGDNSPQSEDFLLRGGINAPSDAAKDVVRLTKMFGDLKSPNGLLFVAKQNLLSRIAVRTQTSGIGLNEGIYTPLTTLIQAGIGFRGGHFNKQGLIPFELKTYSEVMDKQYRYNQNPGGGDPTETEDPEDEDPTKKLNNRLYGLYITKIVGQKYKGKFRRNNLISKDPNQILSYSGGPNSSGGLGKTITFISKNKNHSNWQTSNNTITWDSGLLGNVPITNTFLGYNSPTTSDFRKPLRDNLIDPKSSTIMSLAPSYKPKDGYTIDGLKDSRINYISPGQSNKNLISYTRGSGIGPIDKINAKPIYQSTTPTLGNDSNDLVTFRIASINSSNPKLKQYIQFRAYIDSFSDKYGAKWNSISYMGRGEDFYKYGGFDRSISLSFTVAAQSKEELMAQYKKLNFLASNLAPVYTSNGYMGGPLVTLTMGGWCYELPGFIKSLTLDVPKESPWEIGINDEGEKDPTVKELPHIVKVTGFSFTPIHTFRPEKQTNGYSSDKTPEGEGEVSSYGNQRYIQLYDGEDDNYDS